MSKIVKLFLDDFRIPKDAINLVPTKLNKFYWENDWFVVKTYNEFVDFIQKNGLPTFVSFDHDLADFHYDYNPDEFEGMSEEELFLRFGSVEKTGMDCARWLVDYCYENKLVLPDYVVHSANPMGKINIQKFLENAEKHLLNF